MSVPLGRVPAPSTRNGNGPTSGTTGPEPAPLQSEVVSALASLSSTIRHLRALHECSVDDHRLRRQLDRATAQLESIIPDLLRMVEDSTERDGSSTRSPSTARQAELEDGFLAWLADPLKPDELHVAWADEPAVPLREALGELSVSTRALPAEMAATLGLPAGTTIGAAAAELILAVNDPAGPRCRSYRAAAYYLHDLDRSGPDVTAPHVPAYG